MLSVYARHCAPCTLTDINDRRCRCPKWIRGILPYGRQIRTSARTRSWEKAEINARKMEDIADPNKPAVEGRVKIVDVTQSTAFVTMSNPDT